MFINRLKLSFIGLTIVLMSQMANATYVVSGDSDITFLIVYGRGTAPGDVMVRLSNPASTCVAGYYIEDGTAGKQEILSILLSAYHTGKRVRIQGYDDVTWRGSSNGDFCEIEGVNFVDY